MNYRILITDHYRENLMALADALKNYDITVAKGISNAIECIKQNPFDLVLIGRPERGPAIQDTIRFARNLRERGKRRVVLIGEAYQEHFTREHELQETGANEALQTPINKMTLRQRLDMILQKDSLVTGTFREDLNKGMA